jgi:hypothetical protein
MEAHGLRPLDAGTVIGRIQAKLDNPAIGTNIDTKKALEAVVGQIDEWVNKGGGQLNAEAIYGIRKNLNSTIESLLGTGDPKATKATAAAIAARVRPIIDDAIENAGGTGWRNYLNTYTKGMEAIERRKMASAAGRMLEKQPAKFESMVAGNEPKAVTDVFGPGRYDIAQEMGPRAMNVMEKAAGELARDRSISEGAKRANAALNAFLEENKLGFTLPNYLDRERTLLNYALRAVEKRINKSTADALFNGFKNGRSMSELLNTLPTAEKLSVLREIQPYIQAASVSGAQQ